MITTKKNEFLTCLFIGDEVVGTVDRTPNIPRFPHPGKWNIAIKTADGGVWDVGHFKTEGQAVEAGKAALEKNMTLAQWTESMKKAAIDTIRMGQEGQGFWCYVIRRGDGRYFAHGSDKTEPVWDSEEDGAGKFSTTNEALDKAEKLKLEITY